MPSKNRSIAIFILKKRSQFQSQIKALYDAPCSQIKTSTQIKYTNLLGQQVLILKEWSVLKKVFIDSLRLILPCVSFFIILFRSENSSVRRAFLCRPQFVCLSRESVLGHPSIFMWGGQGVGWSTRGMDLPVFGTVLLYMRPGEGANLDKHTPPKHSYFLHLRHSRKRWVLNWLYRFRAMWYTWFLVQIE